MDKSMILTALKDLGFRTEHLDGYGYVFSYDGLRLLYNPDESDEDFFRISAPYIYEIENEENRAMVLEVANEVNTRIKYVKTIVGTQSVWCAYEHHILGEVDPEELVRFSVLLVFESVELFNKTLNGEGSSDDDDDEEVEAETAESDENDENTNNE